MHGLVESARGGKAVAVIGVDARCLKRVTEKLGKAAAQWVRSSGFAGEPGKFCLVPDVQGHLRAVLVGVARSDDLYSLAALPQVLPAGDYRLDDSGLALDPVRAALGWGLGAYRFSRYRKRTREPARLHTARATTRMLAPLLGLNLAFRQSLLLVLVSFAIASRLPDNTVLNGSTSASSGLALASTGTRSSAYITNEYIGCSTHSVPS